LFTLGQPLPSVLDVFFPGNNQADSLFTAGQFLYRKACFFLIKKIDFSYFILMLTVRLVWVSLVQVYCVY